ncbi:MAG: hypothetical protein QF719_05405 [Chloroflexota bacterium]|jgi:hypothetical protein|nr:hypothetical protein [Chloroflexota bacterium]MDP6757635.1 hypothetical protein [Chloroflexota bacterium]
MRNIVETRAGRGVALALASWIALAACGGASSPAVVEAVPTATLVVTPVPEVATPEPARTASPSAALELATTDEAAKLSIPAGALPPGIDPGDVRIGPVEADDVPATFEDASELVALRLEPDGLQLLEPATLEIRVENGGEGVPIVWHVSSGADDPEGGPRADVMSATEVLLEPEEGTATVRLEVDSFSWVVTERTRNWLTVQMAMPDQVPVGRTFLVHTTTTFEAGNFRSTMSWYRESTDEDMVRVYSVDVLLPWEITEGVFSPGRALGDIDQENSPGPTVVDGDVFTFNSGFTCHEASFDIVHYRVGTRYPERRVEVVQHVTGENAGLFEENIVEWNNFIHLRIHDGLICVEPTPTPTPTATPIPPTPTATATPTEAPTPAMEQVTPSTLEIGG